MNNTAVENFNDTLDQWIAYLDDYSFEMLTRNPIPGSWSIGQVYVHLINDTAWHVGQMKLAMTTDYFANEEMHEDAKWMFANNQFPDAQLENPSNVNMPQPKSKDEIRQKLLEIRTEVNQAIRSPALTISKGKTRHPGLQFFSAIDWLRFTEMHLRHHLRQKARIDHALRNS